MLKVKRKITELEETVGSRNTHKLHPIQNRVHYIDVVQLLGS